MGLGAIAFFFCFSSVREDGSPSDTPSGKDGTIPSYAGAAFLYVLYGIAMAVALSLKTVAFVFIFFKMVGEKRKLKIVRCWAKVVWDMGVGDALIRMVPDQSFFDSLFHHPAFKY